MTHPTINQLLLAIQAGTFDNDIQQISDAIRARALVRNPLPEVIERPGFAIPSIHNLKVGQEVWFNNKVNPKYLTGVKARIVEIKRVRVVVDIIDKDEAGRFQGRTKCPLDILSTTPITRRY